MAWEQHFRRKFIEFVRMTIGDPDGVIFTDDELKPFIETYITTALRDATLIANDSRYRIAPCCTYFPGCACGRGIYLLNVTTGVDGAVYILDEQAGWVIFDPADPENTAVAPVDGSTIEVQFYPVDVPSLFSEIFFTLSSSHAKLKLAFNIMGTSQNLTQLADSFYRQAVRWETEK